MTFSFYVFFKKTVDKRPPYCYNKPCCECGSCCAGVAQLVEQLICNQQVGGSNPSTSSTFFRLTEYGGVPKWPKGTDCKSAGFAYDGSNPSSSTRKRVTPSGVARFLFEDGFERRLLAARRNLRGFSAEKRTHPPRRRKLHIACGDFFQNHRSLIPLLRPPPPGPSAQIP